MSDPTDHRAEAEKYLRWSAGAAHDPTDPDLDLATVEAFSGTRAGDDHRTGSHDAPIGSAAGRRCLETHELVAAGLWVTLNPQGAEIWHGRAAKARDGRQHRR